MLVTLELIGNDICAKDIQKIIKPEKFKRNIVEILKKLDNKLPSNSHVLILGIVQGHKLYEAMAEK